MNSEKNTGSSGDGRIETMTNSSSSNKETKARLMRMQQAARADLVRRGVLEQAIGLDLDTRLEEGKMIAWRFTVSLRSGEQLVYTQTNADDAPLYCDGELLTAPNTASADQSET